jgi:hypothetical protein
MSALGWTLEVPCTFALASCRQGGAKTAAECHSELGSVGLVASDIMSTSLKPGGTLMFGNFNLDCDSGCPVLNRQWTLTPASPGAGTVSITYGADCLDGFNPQGTCPLTLSGTASLDNNLFEATCPNLVTDLAPCGSDKTGDTGPYVQFANASNVDLVVSGPGPGSKPTADCSYNGK